MSRAPQHAAILHDLARLADGHQRADEYRAGHYEWRDGACGIGCAVRDAVALGRLPADTDPGDHEALARATDVPELYWRLLDYVFESLPVAERSAWPPRALRAAAECRQPETLAARIVARLMERLALDAREDVREAARAVAALYRRRAAGEEPSADEWDAAWRQADAAWWQARAARDQTRAARRQARAAWWQADAARDQAVAAWWQADAAWWQARAARDQARAAQDQARAAWWQADTAWWQARAAWRQADAAWWQQADAAWWRWCADMLCEEAAR